MKTIIPITLTLVYTLLILAVSYFIGKSPILLLHTNPYINFQINFQFLVLIITAISLATTYVLNKSNFVNYFTIGEIDAPTKELKLFGIKQNDGWLKTGLSLCLVISIATGVFMYFQLKNTTINWTILQSSILWILLFSLTNSFSEETIYRIGIISPLAGVVSPVKIFFISSILFGLPHFFGMPSGIIGVLMAGILGYVLAKSVYETNGFFWAWIIHFLQDVMIITSLYVINSNHN